MKKYTVIVLALAIMMLAGCSSEPVKGWEGTKTINKVPATYNKETEMVTTRFQDYTVTFKLPDGFVPVNSNVEGDIGIKFTSEKEKRLFGLFIVPQATQEEIGKIVAAVKKQVPDTKMIQVKDFQGLQANINPYKHPEQGKFIDMSEQNIEQMKGHWISVNTIYTPTHIIRLDAVGEESDTEMPAFAESIVKTMQIQRN
ncbi:hypothetical protein [Aneurinibacillus sp. REN35]|uniref:hypothetical protein n=1 Tax=Aneurinibacillus sp. REN35 TaxID=3237286 RepID=UPI0035283AF0